MLQPAALNIRETPMWRLARDAVASRASARSSSNMANRRARGGLRGGAGRSLAPRRAGSQHATNTLAAGCGASQAAVSQLFPTCFPPFSPFFSPETVRCGTPPLRNVVDDTQGREFEGSRFETCSGVWYRGGALVVWPLTPLLIQISWLGNPQSPPHAPQLGRGRRAWRRARGCLTPRSRRTSPPSAPASRPASWCGHPRPPFSARPPPTYTCGGVRGVCGRE